MKTPVEVWFDKFLTFMEPAWTELGPEQFKELEEKIKAEIKHRQENV